MAIKEISYSVSVAGISPATEQHGGTQSEHRAVKLIFNIDDELRAKIAEQSESGKAVYRFDAYDGEGGLVPGAPRELGADTVPEFYLEQWLTRAGGKIRIYLVITAIENGTTEMELYSFPARLVLNNLPNANLLNDADNLESVSVAAQNAIDAAKEASEVSHSAKEVADSANDTAQKASKTAQSVRDDADNGVFNGKQGERGPSGVYVGSGEMPEGYNVQIDPNGDTLDMNTIATKEYVDAAVNSIDPEVDLSNYATKAELNDELDIIEQTVSDISVDYITEKGETTVDGVTWSWEKWNSGKAVCWGTKFWELSRTGNYWWGDISLPFTFYKAANTINDFCITLSGGTNHTGALYTDSTALYSTSTVTVINTASDYVEEAHDVVVHYHIIGKWK